MDVDMSVIITVSRVELQHNRWIPHGKKRTCALLQQLWCNVAL